MLMGVERLVDLTGPQISALPETARQTVFEAVSQGDVDALRALGGHFAATGRAAENDQTVRMARTIGIPLRYFVAKMFHGPFLVVSDRIDRSFQKDRLLEAGWRYSQRI